MSDSQVTAGGNVLYGYIDGDHTKHTVIAHVLSVGATPEGEDLPRISVVFPRQPFDVRQANSPDWQKAFLRITDVPHFLEDAVQERVVSSWWGHYMDPATLDPMFATSVPEPPAGKPAAMRDEADARRLDKDAQKGALPDYVGAAAVQAGQLPEGSVQSPAVNEGFTAGVVGVPPAAPPEVPTAPLEPGQLPGEAPEPEETAHEMADETAESNSSSDSSTGGTGSTQSSTES
jgi:hypothetical protein